MAQPVLPDAKKVTINISDIPLGNLLRLCCDLANVSFTVGEHSIDVGPRLDKNALFDRTFILPPTFFVQRTEGASDKIHVQQTLQEKGIQFPPGACAVYLSTSSKLVIRDTDQQLELVEELVRLTQPGNQKTEN